MDRGSCEGSTVKTHKITGGGGVALHVVETGNPKGRPILFIHGCSQCWLAWTRQMQSNLADDYRLVAIDLRGHGLSDKPREGYADSRLWADDVQAAIQALRLDHPILCGWSYGPLVILDYIRHYGADSIGGINFVGRVSKLGGISNVGPRPEFLASYQVSFQRISARACAVLRRCYALLWARAPDRGALPDAGVQRTSSGLCASGAIVALA